MTQQQQQYDQYQQQQQQQQNPVYQQPHQHHSANELYDMYDEYATGKRCSFLRSQCGNFMIFLSLRFYVKSNLGEARSSKTAVFAIFEALNFVDLVNFSLSKLYKFSASICVKMADFALLGSSNLISRKI